MPNAKQYSKQMPNNIANKCQTIYQINAKQMPIKNAKQYSKKCQTISQ